MAIRDSRADILDAVRRDFGTRFEYWQLPVGQLPEPEADGPDAYVVVDDELLPSVGGEKVRVGGAGGTLGGANPQLGVEAELVAGAKRPRPTPEPPAAGSVASESERLGEKIALPESFVRGDSNSSAF